MAMTLDALEWCGKKEMLNQVIDKNSKFDLALTMRFNQKGEKRFTKWYEDVEGIEKVFDMILDKVFAGYQILDWIIDEIVN